jgi:hypothetical protein
MMTALTIRYHRRPAALAGLGQPSSAGASSQVSPGSISYRLRFQLFSQRSVFKELKSRYHYVKNLLSSEG